VSDTLLRIEQVTARYGKLAVLHGVSVDIGLRQIVALIGANGAGKTTLMMSVFGRPRATGGNIIFEGRDITPLPAHTIARLGIAQSPEGRRIFPRMTVFENLQMGALIADNPKVFDEDLDRVCTLFPVLKSRRDQRGGTLSGGEQQMLAIARALMGRPKLLLLDEPSLGLAPLIVTHIFEVIKELNRQGLTLFIVEQNAYHALKLADRGYVMVNGRITLTGSGAELLNSEEVQTAYLEGGRRKETQGAAP
jgi:branched-chain amino acid transport system ATP-binding protein